MTRREISIPADSVLLTGDLWIPERPCGLVLFVHGSGSSRLSRRNQLVAEHLNENGLATLLFDLLTPEEDTTRDARFDIGLLTDRVDAATRWLDSEPELAALPLGYFGASTGAAAALAASIRHKASIKAVISRGGRPDLAAGALPSVTAPTLLIVGSLDTVVIDLNHQALQELACEATIEIVEGASHLFEEPGKLEMVSELASGWFARHLCGA